MKQYQSLAKLHHNLVNEARREIRRLQDEKDQMVEYKNMMQKELNTLDNHDITHAVDVANYNAYRKKLNERVININVISDQISIQIEHLEEQMREHFANQKVFDNLYDRALQRALTEEQKKTTEILDELSMIRYSEKKRQ